MRLWLKDNIISMDGTEFTEEFVDALSIRGVYRLYNRARLGIASGRMRPVDIPDVPGVGAQSGKGRGANTKQNAETDRIVREEGLSKGQQDILHRWISKQGYSAEEIRDLAKTVKDSFPNK